MLVLTVNIGTSSVKCALFDFASESLGNLITKTRAYPLHKSDPPMVSLLYPSTESYKETITDPDVALKDAIELALYKAGKNAGDLGAIGVRIVHSAGRFSSPVTVTDEVLSVLDQTKHLAPLHNPPAVSAIGLLRHAYPAVSIVAVFDTLFHETMPPKATQYAIQPDLAKSYGVRRYGFHGLAHSSMLKIYCQETKIPADQATIITAQLGSGCSLCAIKNGKSVDTTMGFSPLEGLISRTRTGDIDSATVIYLAQVMNRSASEIIDVFNHESGLLGMAGSNGDMKDILAQAKDGNPKATFAVDMYVYRIQKYLGAYNTILGKTDSLILGGGVSEHCPNLWQKICDLPAFGILLKTTDSISLNTSLTKITSEDSKIPVYIATVDEENEIADLTHQHLSAH